MKIRILWLVLSILALALIVGRAVGVIPGLSPDAAESGNQNQDAAVSAIQDPASPGYEVREVWYEGADGYVKAENLHRSSQTAVIVYFYTDWCPYCKRLDNDLFPSAEVSEYLKSLIKVRINPEKGPDEFAWANRFGVHGYPSVFVLPPQSDAPTKVYPFKRIGDGYDLTPPREFIGTLREAGGP